MAENWRGAVSGAVAGLIVAGLWIISLWPASRDASAALAAWVQALGALVAIGIAIWLPRRDQNRKRDTFRATVLTYAKMIEEGINAKAIKAGVRQDVVQKITVQTSELEIDLQVNIEAIEKLPLAELESEIGVEAAVRLAGAARAYLRAPPSTTVSDTYAEMVNGWPTQRYAADQVTHWLGRLQLALSQNTSKPGTAATP